MNTHKNDLGSLTVRQLLGRRRAAAARLGDVEQVLAGTLTEQARRCGRPGCRCEHGVESRQPSLVHNPGRAYACLRGVPRILKSASVPL